MTLESMVSCDILYFMIWYTMSACPQVPTAHLYNALALIYSSTAEDFRSTNDGVTQQWHLTDPLADEKK